MKKMMTVWFVLIWTLAVAGCGATNTVSQAPAATTAASSVVSKTEKQPQSRPEGKTLVVYFSATGTTKGVAEQIAGYTNADLYEITAAQPYTPDDLNYNNSNSRATREQHDQTVRPKIGSESISLGGYDTIYIGYPIWWGEEPRIMDTFVESYDFSGKTIMPFCTSGSSDIGSSDDHLKANAGSGNWKEGKRLTASDVQSRLNEWNNQ